jgi:ABC-type Fe3+/spermidine/putrescine transport system ATPase subunit
VYVTHDLAEALVLGDRMAVMRQGRIEQIGHPVAVYQAPGTIATAQLLGFRSLGSLRQHPDDRWTPRSGGEFRGALPVRAGASESVEVFARPDRVRICAPGSGAPDSVAFVGGVIEEVVGLGTHIDVVVSLGTLRLRLVDDPDNASGLRAGAPVDLVVARKDVQVYAADGADWTDRDAAADRSDFVRERAS